MYPSSPRAWGDDRLPAARLQQIVNAALMPPTALFGRHALRRELGGDLRQGPPLRLQGLHAGVGRLRVVGWDGVGACRQAVGTHSWGVGGPVRIPVGTTVGRVSAAR